ncbi:MAG: hypothetical protein AAF645_14400 [Myxococcota bacterium]
MIAALAQVGAAVLLFAAWLFVHLRLLALVLMGDGQRSMKLAALLPPVLPWAAWKVGKRKSVIGWALLGGLYAVALLAA